MSIKVGDQIPTSTLSVMTDTGPEPVSTHELFSGKKVVLFSVPGAFTPPAPPNTCRDLLNMQRPSSPAASTRSRVWQ